VSSTDEISSAVTDWLAEPVSLPTAAGIERVAQRVRGTRQRRGWVRLLPRWPRLLIPAVAIMALGTAALAGSVLLTGASPTPTLTTEVVEPGVERILSDGIRDLSVYGDGGECEFAITPDGAVWLYEERPTTGEPPAPPAYIKLGDPRSYAAGPKCVAAGTSDLKVGQDGSLWARTDADSFGRLEGDTWSDVGRTDFYQPWDIGPDGSIWRGDWPFGIARLDAAGWTEHPIDLDVQRLVDYADEVEYAQHNGSPGWPWVASLRVDANGDAWVALQVADFGNAPMVLAHFDGKMWSLVDPVGSGKYSNVDLLDIGDDGTLWVYLEVGLPDQVRPYLARLANDRWTVFSAEEGVVRLVWRGESRGLLRAGHDGAVWMKPQDSDSCQGVRVFDGDAWRSYLDQLCVKDIEMAPDGSVWALAGGESIEGEEVDHGLYRIDPRLPSATP
jgi:hypothetical protein